MTVTDTTFSGNSITSSYVAYGAGAYLSSCTTTMLRSVFSSNYAGDRGGGLYIAGGTTTLNRTNFDSNYAASGGGLFASGGILTVSTSSIGLNTAIYGGGAYVADSAQSTWVECKWSSNAVTGRGGGAYITGSGTSVVFIAYDFFSNTAASVLYYDLYVATGSTSISNGCADGMHNFGTDILRCYGCQAVYPANVSESNCKPWSLNSTASTADQLARQVMFNHTINLKSDIDLRSEVAVLGNFEPLTNLKIDGAGLWQISGGDAARCFYVANAHTEVLFDGIIVTNCRATTESFSFNYGAGMFMGKYAAVFFHEVKILNSSAVNGYGSGLYVADRAMLNASYSHVNHNHGGSQGAGIYVDSGSVVDLFFVVFRGNQATSSGGGCYSNGGTLQLQSCAWYSNEALNSVGGALYLSSSSSITKLMTYEFYLNTAASYNDVYKASGTLIVDNGCSEGEYTYGSGILLCYGCTLTYPANLSHTQCRPWTANAEVQSGRELAGAVMHNSTVNIIQDVTVFSEVAVVGYIPLTGVVFDGDGVFTIYASQEQQRRRALLATATTR